MKARKKKILPQELHTLAPYIDDEISKEQLIQRISGKVERSVLFYLKCLQFWKVGKLDNQVYII